MYPAKERFMRNFNIRHIFLIITFCAIVTPQFIAKDAIKKEHVSRIASPALTKVNVYNPAPVGTLGHVLPVTLSQVKSSGKSLDQSRYWPEVGDTIVAYGPTSNNKSGITQIAEFSRWTGLASDTDYEFTQVIDLPGVGPVLFLKQRMHTTHTNTQVWIGIAAPEFDIQEQFFSDDLWHQIRIPHTDKDGEVLGDFIVTFCLYHWNSLSYQIGKMSAYSAHSVHNTYNSPFGTVTHAFSSIGSILLGGGVADVVAMEEGDKFLATVDQLLANNEQKFQENMRRASDLVEQKKAQYESNQNDRDALADYKEALRKREETLGHARGITQAAQQALQRIGFGQLETSKRQAVDKKTMELRNKHIENDRVATEGIRQLAKEKKDITDKLRKMDNQRTQALHRKTDVRQNTLQQPIANPSKIEEARRQEEQQAEKDLRMQLQLQEEREEKEREESKRKRDAESIQKLREGREREQQQFKAREREEQAQRTREQKEKLEAEKYQKAERRRKQEEEEIAEQNANAQKEQEELLIKQQSDLQIQQQQQREREEQEQRLRTIEQERKQTEEVSAKRAQEDLFRGQQQSELQIQQQQQQREQEEREGLQREDQQTSEQQEGPKDIENTVKSNISVPMCSAVAVGAVLLSATAAAVLTMGMPTPYANAACKIEYKKRIR